MDYLVGFFGTSVTIVVAVHANIEIFFRMNCIIDDPQVFGTAWNWEKKPYDFLEGFCVTTDNHTIKITQIHYNK